MDTIFVEKISADNKKLLYCLYFSNCITHICINTKTMNEKQV